MWALTRVAIVVNLVIFASILFVSLNWPLLFGGQAQGYAIGSLSMLLNLHLIAYMLAPVVHTGRGALVAVAGMVGSLMFMGFVSFVVYAYLASGLVGFALGLISPAFFGVVYARRQMLKDER